MITSNFDLEKELSNNYGLIIGVDEVGRGPLCGPVVAAATLFRDQEYIIPEELQREFGLIRDSKKLSGKQREEILDFIQKHFWTGTGLCNHQTIDRINILEASFLAMKKAIAELEKKIGQENVFRGAKRIVLVDGNKNIPNLSLDQRAVVGGDKRVKSISAASIVAKVARDKIMLDFHQQYPQYRFDLHKGYGTKLHLAAIKQFGPAPIHRRSFEPIKSLAKSREE
jgi:ribonuclease HII